ncbi:MAG: acyl-CoA thioesterase, partial [Leptotrichiaceae bacterium]|nr:acyl-CoA thioesterase [Leptotrichiaceae bacterium]
DVKIVIDLKEITSIKVKFFYEIYGMDNVLKATAETLNVTVDKEGKLKRLPKPILDILKN